MKCSECGKWLEKKPKIEGTADTYCVDCAKARGMFDSYNEEIWLGYCETCEWQTTPVTRQLLTKQNIIHLDSCSKPEIQRIKLRQD